MQNINQDDIVDVGKENEKNRCSHFYVLKVTALLEQN